MSRDGSRALSSTSTDSQSRLTSTVGRLGMIMRGFGNASKWSSAIVGRHSSKHRGSSKHSSAASLSKPGGIRLRPQAHRRNGSRKHSLRHTPTLAAHRTGQLQLSRI